MSSIKSKEELDHSPPSVNRVDGEKPEATFVEDVEAAGYSEVYKRHGRVDLDPMPSDEPSDPLNWPAWRKNTLLVIVSIHAMQGPFSAAMIIPAYELFAVQFNKPITTVPYLTSVQILFLGVMPLVWAPISERIGRRPVYLISALVSAACALAGGFCHSYGTLMTTRVIQAVFLSPPQGIGASTVRELFFSYQKGQKMGVWTLFITLGPILAPLINGYLVQNKGWQASFWLLAAIHLTLFVAHLIFGPETLFLNRPAPGQKVERTAVIGWKQQYFGFRVYRRDRITLWEICRPLIMVIRPVVLFPALAYSITFSYTNVLMTVFVPQFFGEIFHLTPGPIGLQFIALLIGAILGEQLGGYGSDKLVQWRTKRAGGERVPEYRLGLAVPGFLLAIIGIIVWGAQLQNATEGKWNVTPDVGSAIAIFGQQLITTVCYTYPVESYLGETTDVSTFISFLRQVYAFTAPFYLPIAYAELGDRKASGLFAAIIGIGMLLVMSCDVWGPKWRQWPRQKAT